MMKLSTPFTAFALLAPAAFATLLPACSTDSVTPCSCPVGTTYSESATFAVIGASAKDFMAVTSDYFNTAWLGLSPAATQGPDNEPGVSIRTLNLPTKVGTYAVPELLTTLMARPDGTFLEKWEQLNSTIPLPYHSGNGSFAGLWVTLAAETVFQYETAVIWSNYACQTGHPMDFAKSHESALKNATDILQAQGKLLGITVPSRSTQSF